jgi:hypothetical protein
MLLLFHDRINNNDAQFDQAFQLLQELRQALTAMSIETRKERGEKDV